MLRRYQETLTNREEPAGVKTFGRSTVPNLIQPFSHLSYIVGLLKSIINVNIIISAADVMTMTMTVPLSSPFE